MNNNKNQAKLDRHLGQTSGVQKKIKLLQKQSYLSLSNEQ